MLGKRAQAHQPDTVEAEDEHPMLIKDTAMWWGVAKKYGLI